MKELCIISGKGGTGKTTIAASFAVLSGNKVIADCDVDAPDLHLLLKPEIQREEEELRGRWVARIIEERCMKCGKCAEFCRFDAITDFRVNEFLCEGCSVCRLICENDAIEMRVEPIGSIYVSRTSYGWMCHASLIPGEEASGKLVHEVKRRARELARKENLELILIDGPPGIGCPLIATLSGADVALITAEPTLSGVHDMERALSLAEHFRVHPLVCVNKYDLNEKISERIVSFCEERGIEVAGMIPFDEEVVRALKNGKIAVLQNSKASSAIRDLWERVAEVMRI